MGISERILRDFVRKDVADLTVRVLRKGEGARPEVRLLEHEGRRLVLKDYSAGNRLVRSVGLFLIARERGAFGRLQGLPGIPRFYGQLDPWSTITGYIEGEMASEVDENMLTPAFFERLWALICSMHERGVAHGDLKRLDNIVVGPDGQPGLIDFSSALWNGSNPLFAMAIPYIFDDDLRAVYKLKQRRVPHLLTPEEEQFLADRPLMEHCFRYCREFVRQPVQRLAARNPEGSRNVQSKV